MFCMVIIGNTMQVSAQVMSKQDYIEKSQKQKKTGVKLLVGGVIVGTAGAIIFNENFKIYNSTKANDNGTIVGGAMFAVGALAALGSIPYFISSSSNARNAAQISIRNEPFHGTKYAGNFPRSIPSLTYTIPLN